MSSNKHLYLLKLCFQQLKESAESISNEAVYLIYHFLVHNQNQTLFDLLFEFGCEKDLVKIAVDHNNLKTRELALRIIGILVVSEDPNSAKVSLLDGALCIRKSDTRSDEHSPTQSEYR
jgi:hypothetical protein